MPVFDIVCAQIGHQGHRQRAIDGITGRYFFHLDMPGNPVEHIVLVGKPLRRAGMAGDQPALQWGWFLIIGIQGIRADQGS